MSIKQKVNNLICLNNKLHAIQPAVVELRVSILVCILSARSHMVS